MHSGAKDCHTCDPEWDNKLKNPELINGWAHQGSCHSHCLFFHYTLIQSQLGDYGQWKLTIKQHCNEQCLHPKLKGEATKGPTVTPLFLPEDLHQWQHLKQKFTSNVNTACVIFFHHHLPFFPLIGLSLGWSRSIYRLFISSFTTPETHTTIGARSWDDIRRQTCRIDRRRTQMTGCYWCLRNNNTRWQWQRLSTDLKNSQTKSVHNTEEKDM